MEFNLQTESTANRLRDAYRLAWSLADDPHTKLGAVLFDEEDSIIGIGVNSFPRDVKTTDPRLERPTKYAFIEHAERNAIFFACRKGYCTFGATLYAPWFACADCARAIIQSGISRVVGHKQMFDHAGVGSWSESIRYGDAMLQEAGVETYYYDGVIGGVECLFQSQIWEP